MALSTLLGKRVSLWSNAEASNGAGGFTDAWTNYATVNGDYFIRQPRSGGGEAKEAGQPVDPTVIDVVLDVSGVSPASQDAIRLDAEERWFKLVTIQVQGTVAFVRAREVDPLA